MFATNGYVKKQELVAIILSPEVLWSSCSWQQPDGGEYRIVHTLYSKLNKFLFLGQFWSIELYEPRMLYVKIFCYCACVMDTLEDHNILNVLLFFIVNLIWHLCKAMVTWQP